MYDTLKITVTVTYIDTITGSQALVELTGKVGARATFTLIKLNERKRERRKLTIFE